MVQAEIMHACAGVRGVAQWRLCILFRLEGCSPAEIVQACAGLRVRNSGIEFVHVCITSFTGLRGSAR
jgi:hypothetical protein